MHFARWYGGAAGYSPPTPVDTEKFRTLTAMREALRERYDESRSYFPYVLREPSCDRVPTVGRDSRMDVWLNLPAGTDPHELDCPRESWHLEFADDEDATTGVVRRPR
ncbi:hypothetical protein [Streptomyces sp. TR02-1]|uniref:hypothetical protein n=1 Tax=Streptomyces sp. TR02-1 TaxID=3385977 RepID=UPI0039A21893